MPESFRINTSRLKRRRFADHRSQTEPHQISGPRIANDVVRQRQREHERRQTERGTGDVKETSGRNTEHGHEARHASLTDAATHDVKHVRAGRDVQQEASADEHEQRVEVRHAE